MTIVSVAVADGKEVAVTKVEHVWIGQICVLVNLVWVVSCDATLRCEGKLGNDIVN